MTAAAQTGERTAAAAWPDAVRVLYGVGAQKCGTSWLWDQLAAHPEVSTRPVKELHYWDAIEGRGVREIDARRQKIQEKLANRGKQTPERVARRQAHERLAEICAAPDADHASYLDFLTQDIGEGQRIVADVTPSYSVLSAEMFRQMNAIAPALFLFIMREPVARQWSQIRMSVKGQHGEGPDFQDACRARLDKVLQQNKDTARQKAGKMARSVLKASRSRPRPLSPRSDYGTTLSALAEGVPAEQRLEIFFEDLVKPGGLTPVAEFLGIAPFGIPTASESGAPAEMRPDQAKELTQSLRPVYEDVKARFGDAVPAAWHARFAKAQA